MKANILIIDDELVICQSCEKIFLKSGHNVTYTTSGNQALKILEEKTFDVVFTDLKMIDIGGMEVLQAIKQKYPETIVIVITGYATVASAVETMRYGAFDYLPKPFTPLEILTVLNRAMEKRNLIKITTEEYNYSDSLGFEGIIGKSPSIVRVYNLINKVAPTDSTVLILGESGTGKELTARAIHRKSLRNKNKFFPIDISSLSVNLIESELFGHTKGSFTGAIADKQGVFEAADKGTIFLDEIGNLPFDTQARLLRVLQEKEFLPVGSTTVKKVDIRMVFATNQVLKKAVEEGKFREDLYYRLNVFEFYLLSLKERTEDIEYYFERFIKEFSATNKKKVPIIEKNVRDFLLSYNWPGNIRELKNVAERVSILCENNKITSDLLPLNIIGVNQSKKYSEDYNENKESTIHEFETNFITKHLKIHKGNVAATAKAINFHPVSLRQKIAKLGIDPRDYKY